MPLQATSGAASYDAFGGGVAAVPKYIEDYFSTFLYSGTGSDQTITNNIDLSTKGGLVWLKKRTYPSGSATSHYLMDTNRGTSAGYISSNSTNAENAFDIVSSFNTNGFDFNTPVNDSGDTYVSWSWAKAPKFFDVVTWTGTNSPSSRLISHSLGSQPGHIIMKRTDAAGDWSNWHLDGSVYREFTPGINSTASLNSSRTATNVATSTSIDVWYTQQTSGVGDASGATYVAYIFAHNAGGFGLTGTDNVISCGSFTTSGSGQPNATINLGYEPQWIMYKRSDATGDWRMQDNMRGLLGSWTGNSAFLRANTSDAESQNAVISITPTGFLADTGTDAQTYIYIAIRRGPMKAPTVGTSVFSPNYATSTTGDQITTGFPVDSQILRYLPAGIGGYWFDRLRGVSTTSTESGRALYPNATTAETTENYTRNFNNTGYQQNSGFAVGTQMIGYNFRRAPSFFDVVCYTGTGTAGQTFSHNLGVVPELMIVKKRNASGNWPVYSTATGNTNVIYLNFDTYASASNEWNNTTPTASVFTLGTNSSVNNPGNTYVAYLFATCPGVSKVGSYTGTGAAQTINCGFTTGSRFVLIKRYDNLSVGDWFVWDSARGIIPANDPYLALNSTATEVTGTDYIDTTNVGFDITSTAPAAINASGGSFIFLAIA